MIKCCLFLLLREDYTITKKTTSKMKLPTSETKEKINIKFLLDGNNLPKLFDLS